MLAAILVFKPLCEYWRIPDSLLVNFPVQRKVDTSSIEHGLDFLKLEEPWSCAAVDLNVNHLARGFECAVLLNIEIKALF